MFIVYNKGKEIAFTDYWETELAQDGYFFVAVNAGCLRILVPQMLEKSIEEMRTGKRVLIEPSAMRPDIAIDFVFDNETNNPFWIAIEKEMIDRKLEPGRCTVAVISKSGKQLELDAFVNI